jgi:hypothetical protein
MDGATVLDSGTAESGWSTAAPVRGCRRCPAPNSARRRPLAIWPAKCGTMTGRSRDVVEASAPALPDVLLGQRDSPLVLYQFGWANLTLTPPEGRTLPPRTQSTGRRRSIAGALAIPLVPAAFFASRPFLEHIGRQGRMEYGGDAGIRTLDTGFGPYAPLAGECLRPLGHVSGKAVDSTRRRLLRSNRRCEFSQNKPAVTPPLAPCPARRPGAARARQARGTSRR